jgi:hypothetical protein
MDPMQMLQPYFRPPVDYLAQGLQQRNAMQRHSRDLAERQRQFNEQEPYRNAQVSLARNKVNAADEKRKAREALAQIYGVKGLKGIQAGTADQEAFLNSLKAGYNPITDFQLKQPSGKWVTTTNDNNKEVQKYVVGTPGMELPVAPKQPSMPTIGTTRQIFNNEKRITQAWNGREWEQLGVSPQWNPNTGNQENKILKQLADDYEARQKEINRLSYKDYRTDENIAIAQKMIDEQLVLAAQYERNGGDIRNLGMNLPPGLTAADLQHNWSKLKDKYGLTSPDQIIERYVNAQGQ